MKFQKNVSSRRLRLMALALIVGTTILDTGTLGLEYLRPVTVDPSDSNFINNPASNGEALIRLSQEEGKTCDIIFIGASNVEYWTTEGASVWNKYYVPRNAFNFGVAGDSTQNVLWRFDHMSLQGKKPKAAVIFIGLNNLTATPHELALGVKAIVKKTQSLFPGVKVLMVSITPDDRDNHRIELANEVIKTYANNKTVFYIDLYSKILRNGPHWDGLKPDHLHLTEKGYGVWAEAMEPTLQKILPLSPEPTANVSVR